MSEKKNNSKPEGAPRPTTNSEDTRVHTLGPATIPSPLTRDRFANGARINVRVESGTMADPDCDSPNAHVSLEEGGPRSMVYFDPPKTKFAVVTCGGLCPGINDVIRAIVMEARHNYGLAAVLGVRYGLEGFIPSYAHPVMELTPRQVSRIQQFGGTILGSSRGPQPVDQIVDALERMNVDALFMIGGNGTMRAAKAIHEEIASRGLRKSVIGIPKTIDNDITFVTTSLGFDTAVEKATEAISCAHVEATGAVNGIGMVKVMGRESGFIAAQAALAMKDVNLVLIPEDPFELHGERGLLRALERRLDARGHALLVVAEGAGQHLLEQSDKTDASGNPVLGDICGLLIAEIKKHFKALGREHTLKFIDPSYIIRSVPANANDRIYCGFLGQNAVHAAMAGKTGMVVSKWNARYVHIPLSLVTRGRRRLDTGSNYWKSVLETTGQERYFHG